MTGRKPQERDAATAALLGAGWTRGKDSWRAPGHKDELTLTLLALDAETNPLTHAVAEAVAAAETLVYGKHALADLED